MTSAAEPSKCVRIVRFPGNWAQFPDNPARAYGHKKPFSTLSLIRRGGSSRAREQDCQDFTARHRKRQVQETLPGAVRAHARGWPQ